MGDPFRTATLHILVYTDASPSGRGRMCEWVRRILHHLNIYCLELSMVLDFLKHWQTDMTATYVQPSCWKWLIIINSPFPLFPRLLVYVQEENVVVSVFALEQLKSFLCVPTMLVQLLAGRPWQRPCGRDTWSQQSHTVVTGLKRLCLYSQNAELQYVTNVISASLKPMSLHVLLFFLRQLCTPVIRWLVHIILDIQIRV